VWQSALALLVAGGLAGCSGASTDHSSADSSVQRVQLAADMPIAPPTRPPMPVAPPPERLPGEPVRPPMPDRPPPRVDPISEERDNLYRENLALRAANEQLMKAGVAKGHVRHVVLLWLKKPGDAAIRKTIIETTASLRDVPGVVDVVAGTMLPSERKVVDSTYDVGVIITFKNEQALRDYDQHPKHLKAVNEVLKPNVEKLLVYDFVEN
jgi:hypothetical protein